MKDRRIEWLSGAALMLLVVLTFLPATQAGFIWDDDLSVTDNPALRSASGLVNLWIRPGTTTQYYPLLFTSFWLEYHAWELHPFGYHLNNILLHGACAVLLWRVLRRLGVPGAWFAAAIFGVHPVQVETVAWVYERKNILSLLFYLAAAWAWLRFYWDETADSPDRRPLGYGLTLGLYACALLTKVTTVVFAPSLLVIAWWKRGRVTRREVLVTLPMLAMAVPVGLLTRSLESGLGDTLGFEWHPTAAERVLQIGRAVFFYLAKLAWPADLAFVYRRWEIDAGDPLQWAYPIGLVALAAALYATRDRIGRAPLAALLLFTGTLAPVLGFLEVYFFRFSYVADHWQYMACIAPIALVVGGGSTWLERRAPGARRGVAVVAIGVVAVLGSVSWRYTHAFRSPEQLWRDSLTKNPDALLARYNLGVALQRDGRLVEAMRQYEAASELAPDEAIIWANMGLVRAREGRLKEAEALYRKSLELEPNRPRTHWNLGLVLEATGRFDEALPHLERAFQVAVQHPREQVRLLLSHAQLGDLLLEHGRPGQARVHYQQALEHQPDLLPARLGLARSWLDSGRPERAERELEWILRAQPGHVDARMLLERSREERAATQDDDAS